MFTLILYAFLSASPDGQVRTVREVVATGLTWDECHRKKAVAIAAAKRERLKQVGGACVTDGMMPKIGNVVKGIQKPSTTPAPRGFR